MTRKAIGGGAAQAQRFKDLAKDVGADESPEELADAVRKLAAAGPFRRKPIKARASKSKR